MKKTMILLVAILGLSTVAKAQGTFVSNCETYTTVAPIVCDTCKGGFTKSAAGQCLKCPEGCSACNLASTTAQVCTGCANGFYLNLGSCLSCGVGCQTCDQTAGTCNQCLPGFGLSSGKQCVQCTANCGTCSSTGQCSTCNNGYTLSTNDQGVQQCVWSPNSSVASQGATPGVITWIFVLFIVCAAIFTLLCYFLFSPSYHTGESGSAYVPLSQKPVVAQPTYVAPVVTQPVIAQPVYTYAAQPVATRPVVNLPVLAPQTTYVTQPVVANPYASTARIVSPGTTSYVQGPGAVAGVSRPGF